MDNKWIRLKHDLAQNKLKISPSSFTKYLDFKYVE